MKEVKQKSISFNKEHNTLLLCSKRRVIQSHVNYKVLPTARVSKNLMNKHKTTEEPSHNDVVSCISFSADMTPIFRN